MSITVVLADDHAVVRGGLRLVLAAEDDLRVVAEAATIADAVRLTEAHRPSVVVLDLNMPDGAGGTWASSLDALPTLAAAAPGSRVVILTMEDDPRIARKALAAGAVAYVLKESADGELVAAVRAAVAGGSYPRPATPPARPADLTARESEVLALIALGHTNAEIGGRLFLSLRTVESIARRAPLEQA